MEKCILVFILIILSGWLGMVIGLEYLGGFVEFGSILAIATMGALIVYFNDKKN